jgi:hypothetical protein
VGRGRSADAEVVAAGGFFPDIGKAGQSIDEVRLVAERMFYLLKRYPTLLQWQATAMKDDFIATPEVGKALTDVHRLTDQVEQLPQHVAAERQAVLTAFDDRLKIADAGLSKLRGALTDANRTGKTLDKLLKTADSIFTRFDAWDRWADGQPGHRDFDAREYTEGIKQLAVAAGKMNDLMKASNELLTSSEWGRRMGQVSESADGRINMASEQSQRVVNAAFWRMCLAIGVFFVMLTLYRLATHLLARRLRITGESTGEPNASGGNGGHVRRSAHAVGRGGLS